MGKSVTQNDLNTKGVFDAAVTFLIVTYWFRS